MASVNRVILLGRLGRDPETRESGNTTICRVALATSRRYRDRDGNKKEETEWHNVSLFGKSAELVQQYLHKGDELYIEGRIRTRKYTAKDGSEKYSTEIVAEQMQFGARQSESGNFHKEQPATASTYEDDDPPF